jgi:hypothetical protein
VSYNERGLNAAVDGVTGLGEYLAPCTGDPGTDGSNIDEDVTPLAANWAGASDGSADSEQVGWDIPEADLGTSRDYSHFAVITEPDGEGAYDYVCGGELDQTESFSDNGGTLNFTGTITAEDAPA